LLARGVSSGLVADEVPLELRDGRKNGHQEATDRVSAGLQVQSLGRDREPDAVDVDELADVCDEVEGGPARAIELEDEEDVEPASPGGLEDALEARPVVPGSGAGLLDVEHTRKPSRFAAARSSDLARVGSWSSVETRWYRAARSSGPLPKRGCSGAPSDRARFYTRD
jgi:hypothetical protein